MKLFLSVTFFVFFAMYGIVCVHLTHSSLGDGEDIFVFYLIIIVIKSTFHVVVIFSVLVCLGWLYSGTCIMIPGKSY